MTFEAGSSIGPYRIVECLGAGGMGTVFRAWDPRLSRFVAVKVLHETDRIDAARLRQFEREARAAGALTHPSILVVYDVGDDAGVPYVVAELLEGETLRQGIRRGGLTPRKAVEYAIQIAEGLAAAHDKGIVHRDLKPENVFLTTSGRAKVLDFGLAKLREPPPGAEVGTDDPTRGLSDDPVARLGSANYMSPEQIQGGSVDHRSDIFSLGAVMYETLTGERAFPGRTAEAIAAVLKDDPAPIITARVVPPALERLVRRCLEKRPGDRFQSAHDLAIALQAVAETAHVGAPDPARRRKVLAAAALAGVAAATVGGWTALRGPDPAANTPPRVLPVTSYAGAEYQPALAPDGNYVAFLWDGDNEDNLHLYNKPVGSETVLRLTSDPAPECCPAWSPDARSVAFIRRHGGEGTVFVVPAMGGSERRLATVRTWYGSSLSWSPDGHTLAVSEAATPEGPYGVVLLSLDTLEKRRLTSPSAPVVGDAFPTFSPDGRTIAFARVSAPGLVGADVSTVPVAGGNPTLVVHEPTLVGGLDWTPDGAELVFSSSRTGAPRLWRIRPGEAEPRPLALGENPLLANTTGAEAITDVSNPFRVSIARRGGRLAYTRSFYDTAIWRVATDGREPGPGARLIASTQLEEAPQYSPDGRRIAFSSTRGTGTGQIWVCAAEGSDCFQLTSFRHASGTPRWSPDGRQLAFDSAEEGRGDVFVIDVETHVPRRLTLSAAEDGVPSWSRDGKWVYFASDRTGARQVWRMPSKGGVAVQVTSGGGFAPFESQDGRWVYYTRSDAPGLWRVPAGRGPEERVLDLPTCWGYWALAPAGVYVLDTKALRGGTIELFSFGGGAPRSVARLANGPACGESGLGLSPDGNSLLYVDAVRGSDVMVLENFR